MDEKQMETPFQNINEENKINTKIVWLRKLLLLFPIVFIVISIFLFLFTRSQDKLKLAKKITPTITPASSYETPTPDYQTMEQRCNEFEKANIYIDKKNSAFTDNIHKFELNISALPAMQNDISYYQDLNTGGSIPCNVRSYEVDMYPLRNGPEGSGSVARFGFATLNSTGSGSLMDIAKTELKYVEGKHTFQPDVTVNPSYPVTSSPLVETVLPSGTDMISWTEQYTDQATYREGTTAQKRYLLKNPNGAIFMDVTVWDLPTLTKAASDFDKVIQTFKSTK